MGKRGGQKGKRTRPFPPEPGCPSPTSLDRLSRPVPSPLTPAVGPPCHALTACLLLSSPQSRSPSPHPRVPRGAREPRPAPNALVVVGHGAGHCLSHQGPLHATATLRGSSGTPNRPVVVVVVVAPGLVQRRLGREQAVPPLVPQPPSTPPQPAWSHQPDSGRGSGCCTAARGAGGGAGPWPQRRRRQRQRQRCGHCGGSLSLSSGRPLAVAAPVSGLGPSPPAALPAGEGASPLSCTAITTALIFAHIAAAIEAPAATPASAASIVGAFTRGSLAAASTVTVCYYCSSPVAAASPTIAASVSPSASAVPSTFREPPPPQHPRTLDPCRG